MPGQPIDIDPPLQTDSISDAIAKTAEDLQNIQIDLEAKVVAAEIDINGNLDFNGWQLRGASVLTLVPVADANDFSGGSAVYDGAEWFLVTGAGAVQITLNGAINATGFGAIVGDYGVGNAAAVTYVDTDGVYQFTEDPGVWADIEIDDVILHGALGTTRISCDDAIVGDQELSLNITPSALSISAPVVCSDVGLITAGGWDDPITVNGSITLANTAWLVVNNGGEVHVAGPSGQLAKIYPGVAGIELLINDAGADAVRLRRSGVALFGAADISREKDYETAILPHRNMNLTSTVSDVTTQVYGVLIAAGAANTILVPMPTTVGDRILSLKACLALASGTGSIEIDVNVISADGTQTSLFNSSQAITATLTQYTMDITDHTMAAGEALQILIAANASVNTKVGPVAIIHDRP